MNDQDVSIARLEHVMAESADKLADLRSQIDALTVTPRTNTGDYPKQWLWVIFKGLVRKLEAVNAPEPLETYMRSTRFSRVLFANLSP